jgi:hypothetical protein
MNVKWDSMVSNDSDEKKKPKFIGGTKFNANIGSNMIIGT